MKKTCTTKAAEKPEAFDHFGTNQAAGNTRYNFLGIRARLKSDSNDMKSGETAPSGVWGL